MTHLLGFSYISIFWPIISNFCYIKKYSYRLHFKALCPILLTLLESLQIVLINIVETSMMSAKLDTLDLFEITVYQNKNYDVIISVSDIFKKNWSHESNYIVDVVMWPKFGNYSISMTEVITTSFLWGFDQKKQLFPEV